jgi:nucleoside-diphosphate-sugar epimerase
MKILVTGGAGKLGSLIVRMLSDRGHQVGIFDLPFANFSKVSYLPNVQIFKGDLTKFPQVCKAVKGFHRIIHLAAILPPASERSREKTMMVNVNGTRNLVKAIQEVSPEATIVFASSVSTYGNTAKEEPPIRVNHPLTPSDLYSESKIRAEETIIESGVPYFFLRISGIVAAEIFEFPEVMQFKENQRIEFIDRNDAALALVSAVEEITNQDRVFNIAGGSTWRMQGGEYVKNICKAIGFEVKVNYPKEYGWLDWYETSESQRLFNYQKTLFQTFLKKLTNVFKELFG